MAITRVRIRPYLRKKPHSMKKVRVRGHLMKVKCKRKK